MAMIEGVNVSTALNRQMHAIGNARAGVKQVLRQLGRASGAKGARLSGSETRDVARAAGVKLDGQRVWAVPYGSAGFSVFYYRTGDQDAADAMMTRSQNRFRHADEHAHVWALLLGRFDSDKLIEPEHDNSPEDVEDAPVPEPA